MHLCHSSQHREGVRGIDPLDAGLEIATNTVAFATKFFPLRLKYLEKSQICDFLSPSLFRNKRVSSCHFAATFAKINKEMTKLFCFSL